MLSLSPRLDLFVFQISKGFLTWKEIRKEKYTIKLLNRKKYHKNSNRLFGMSQYKVLVFLVL